MYFYKGLLSLPGVKICTVGIPSFTLRTQEVDMPETGRAIMLGIRHRCGQEVQFWIPADLVAVIARRLDEETEALGLAEWMEGEGILADYANRSPGGAEN